MWIRTLWALGILSASEKSGFGAFLQALQDEM
jgi:hypothetical protein